MTMKGEKKDEFIADITKWGYRLQEKQRKMFVYTYQSEIIKESMLNPLTSIRYRAKNWICSTSEVLLKPLQLHHTVIIARLFTVHD